MIPKTILAFGFAPGPMELSIIAIIAVLLFGNRLPQIARSVGSSVVEFKQGLKGVTDEVDEVRQSVESATRSDNETEARDRAKA